MGLAVSVEHQDRCSVADNLIVEMCLGSIKICAFHDVFFPSGKTERPRGSRPGSGSLPLRKTYPELDASEGKHSKQEAIVSDCIFPWRGTDP